MKRIGHRLVVLAFLLTVTGAGSAAADSLIAAKPQAPLSLVAHPNTSIPTATSQRAQVAGRIGSDTPHAVRLLQPALAGSRVVVTISYRPANPALLSLMAGVASGRRGLPIATLRKLFAPPPELIDDTNRYLHRFGFARESSGLLTQTYAGTVADAQRAFQTTLNRYAAQGVTFRSPATAPTLPAAIAAHVQAVSGLDTYPLYRPAVRVRRQHSALSAPSANAAISASCPGPGSTQSSFGGYQPADLAGPTGYDFQSLIDGGATGHGDVLGLVEFSNYDVSDVLSYESCYGVSVPITDVAVNGGTTTQSAAVEVKLDEEVAMTAAPGLNHIYTYVAPNGTGFAGVIDQMLSDSLVTHTNEISISWASCEPFQDPADLAASDAEFQIAAAAGISVFASSGDDGSSACQGFSNLEVNYPASDPYVTAVGGTTLDTAQAGSARETTWGSPSTGSGGGGGGGVSMLFPIPSWQTGTGVIEPGYSSMSACGQASRYCREVPDVALDANPDSGYIIYCTDITNCGGQGWQVAGGTSAAAPLLAAMTADANSYSLAHGGGRLGFANPFFYSQAGSAVFRDITTGSNNIAGGNAYPAGVGYDMATGLGSPDGDQYSQALAGYTASALSFDATWLFATQSRNAISPGLPSTLAGILKDTNTGLPLADRPIILQGYFTYQGQVYTVHRYLLTNNSGIWSTPVSVNQIGSRMQWYVAYPGEEGVNSARSNWNVLYVRPALSFKATLNWTRQHYVVKHGVAFHLSGASNPIIKGTIVTVQYRYSGGSSWHSSTIKATVGRLGGYSVRLAFSRATNIYLRWHYQGSTSGSWLSANSAARLFVVS